ncbi:hypothetical protein HDF16_003883 [Granulicella aggregans]|uniref:Uncharacterized protein n=1 Tax=Granulicella aggregans TaxID=474949 RepID=A0A7W7ZFV2_9BACT|nr:hypothetical protein [Granulicella aggregans]MBB5059160.1 hypothetical protein [Granulicella aggregans]
MRRERLLKWILLAAGMNCLLVDGARGQNSPSQVLKLPDPTPREIDPRLRNHAEDPAAAAAMRRAVAAQNEKRRQLIVWAANELVVLSERAEKAASGPAGDASKAELAANVNKIETLAKNLAIAMKAQ